MTNATQEAIKKEIGYTQTPAPECRVCTYVHSRGSATAYSCIEHFCGVAGNVGEIPVDPRARCDRFKRRTPCD